MKKRRVLIIVSLLALILSLSLILAACGEKPVRFSVKFSVDGADYAKIDTSGSEVIAMPENPTKEGYDFGGWFWDKGIWEKPFTANSLLDAPLSSDMTVYAKWDKKKFTLTLVTNGGSEIVASEFSELTAYPQTERAGYEIEGLYTDSALLPESKITLPYTLTADTTLYVKWELKEYIINYMPLGGTLPEGMTEFYTIEDEVVLPLTVTKKGYVFRGWYDNAAFSGAPVLSIAAGTTGDVTYYAKWETLPYSITYDTDGGILTSEAPGSYTIENGVTLPSASKEGCSFLGWYDNPQLSGNAVTIIPVGNTGVKQFYAKWTAVNYDLEYHNVNGAENPNPVSYTIEDNEITLAALTGREGYIFDGWYSDSALINPITTIDTSELKSYAFYAKWTLITYTISYELNGGALTSAALNSYTVESADALPEAEKEYYNFLGWYDNAEFNGEAIANIRVGSTGTKQFYAKWEAIKYPIAYELNGGKFYTSWVNDYTVESAEITLPDADKKGYHFAGWYDNAELNGDVITKISAGSTGAKRFYAKWDAAKYRIEYNYVNNSQNSNPSTYTIEDEDITLAQLSGRIGYAFKGWYSDELLTKPITVIDTSACESYVVYAKWEEIPDNKVITDRFLNKLIGYTWENPESVIISIFTSDFSSVNREPFNSLNLYSGLKGFIYGSTDIIAVNDFNFYIMVFDSAVNASAAYNDQTHLDSLATAFNLDNCYYVLHEKYVLLSEGKAISDEILGLTDTSDRISDEAFGFVSDKLESELTDNAYYGVEFSMVFQKIDTDRVFNFGIESFYLQSNISRTFSLRYAENTDRLNTNHPLEPDELTADSYFENHGNFICFEVQRLPGLSYFLSADGTYYTAVNYFYDSMEVKNIAIPEVYKGKPVKEVAIKNNSVIQSILIPESVVTIEDYAFLGCANLKNIYSKASEKPAGWSECWNFTGNGRQTFASYWYSEKEPLVEGSYWHYVNGVPTAWPAYVDDLSKVISDGLIQNLLGFSKANVGSQAGLIFTSDFTKVNGFPLFSGVKFSEVNTRAGLIGFTQAEKVDSNRTIINNYYIAVFDTNANASSAFADKAYISGLASHLSLPAGYGSKLTRNYVFLSETDAAIEELLGYRTTEADYTSAFVTLVGNKINEYIADASFKSVGLSFYNRLYFKDATQQTPEIAFVFGLLGEAAQGNRDKALNLFYCNNESLMSELYTTEQNSNKDKMNQTTADSYFELKGKYIVYEYRHLPGFDYTLSEDKSYYYVSGYYYDDDTAQSVVFPASYNGKPVKEIRGGFNDVPSFSEIVIPDSIIAIDQNAFSGCVNLKTIYCEASAKPAGWTDNWNGTGAENGKYATYWYSEAEPMKPGNFWHYVSGVPTVYTSSSLERFAGSVKSNNFTLSGPAIEQLGLPADQTGERFVLSLSGANCVIDIASRNWRDAIYFDKYVLAYDTVTDEQYWMLVDEGKIASIKQMLFNGLTEPNYTQNGAVYTVNSSAETGFGATYIYSLDFSNPDNIVMSLKNNGSIYEYNVTNIGTTIAAVPQKLIDYSDSLMPITPDELLSVELVDRLIANAMNNRMMISGGFASEIKRTGVDLRTLYGLKGYVLAAKIVEDTSGSSDVGYTVNGINVMIAVFDNAQNAALAYADDTYLASMAEFFELNGAYVKVLEGNCVYIADSQEKLNDFINAPGVESLPAEVKTFIRAKINEYAKYGRYNCSGFELSGSLSTLVPSAEKQLLFDASQIDFKTGQSVKDAYLVYSENAKTVSDFRININLEQMTPDSYIDRKTNYILVEFSPLPATNV